MRLISLIMFLLLLTPDLSWARESSSYKITSEIMDSSGGERMSAAYKMLGKIREFKLNAPQSSSYVIQEGFIPTAFETFVLAVLITSITPNAGYNTGRISIIDLAGTGFSPGTTVRLSRGGEPDIAGENVNVVSSSRITCDFDLTGRATGLWNVVVTNPGGQSATLPSAFNVIEWALPSGQVVINPNPFNPLTAPTTISYQLDQDVTVSVLIFNMSHELIYKQDYNAGTNGGCAGNNDISWDGYNNFAEMAANGVYFCRVVDRRTGRILAKGKIAVSR